MSDSIETSPQEGKAVQPFSQQEAHVMLERTGVNPAMWRMMAELAKQCIASNAFPATLTNPAKALVVMQAGVELGMKPMQAVQSMFFINGKLSMYSSALLAMMKKNGLVVKWKTLSAEMVTGEFSSPNQPAVEVSFGKADAVRAGLSGGNYVKYPQDMFVARCISRVAKLFPDLIGAPIETAEVMEDVAVDPAPQVTESKIDAVPAKLQSNNEKKEVKRQEKQAIAKATPEELDSQYMADPLIAEIIEELKCSETEADFEGVRQMIVGKSWSVDKARYLGDKYVFYKDSRLKKEESKTVEVAMEIFSEDQIPSKPEKKTYEQRKEELQSLKSVDLKPILNQYDIPFNGMDKEQRINTILAWEFPEKMVAGMVAESGIQPTPSSPHMDSPVEMQAPTVTARPGVLGKLFDAKPTL